MMAPRFQRQFGAVLLGVVILAAILLIGAATIGVIYLRQLDQQRKVQTQADLDRAFHGVFPGFRSKGANMFTDFDYRPANPGPPPTNFYDLMGLTTRTAVAGTTVPVVFTGNVATSAPYVSGWNGPYWTGSVDSQNRPVDAWGRAFQLRYISTSSPAGWQVFSLGANGISETNDLATPSGDDQVFPVVPYPIPTATVNLCASPSFTFYRSSYNPAETVTITISWDVNGGGSQTVTSEFNNGAKYYGSPAPVFTNLPYGALTITLTSSKASHSITSPLYYTMDATACSTMKTVAF